MKIIYCFPKIARTTRSFDAYHVVSPKAKSIWCGKVKMQMLVLHAIGKCLIRKQSSAINCEVHAVVLQTILSKNVPKQTRDTNKTL